MALDWYTGSEDTDGNPFLQSPSTKTVNGNKFNGTFRFSVGDHPAKFIREDGNSWDGGSKRFVATRERIPLDLRYIMINIHRLLAP